MAQSEERSTEWRDPVIEAYKRDVDRSLLRENMKLDPKQRLEKLQNFVEFLQEIRTAKKTAKQQ